MGKERNTHEEEDKESGRAPERSRTENQSLHAGGVRNLLPVETRTLLEKVS
jgi:hypothetical protein